MARRITPKFNISEHLKKYLFNTGWLLLEKVLRIFAAILVGIYVKNYLGPYNVGVLAYITTIASFFPALAGLGIFGILVRNLIEHKEDTHNLLGTTFFLKLFAGIVCAIIFIAIVFFVDHNTDERLIALVIATGIIFQAFQVFDLFFQSKVLSKYTVQVQILSLILTSLLKLYFVVYKYPLIYFAIASSLDPVIFAIGYIYLYIKKENNLLTWKFKPELAANMMRESWPLIFSGFVISIYISIDQVMIRNMLGNIALGNYSAAVTISESYYFLPVVICNSIFPAIVNGKKISETEYRRRLQQLFVVLTWTSVSFALFVSVFADQIAYICFKNRFQGVGPVLSLHVWAGVFSFWGTAIGRWLIIERSQIYETINTVLGAVINLGLNFYLIPKYNIMGAALATVIAYGFASLLGYIIYDSTRLAVTLVVKSLDPSQVYRMLFKSNIQRLDTSEE